MFWLSDGDYTFPALVLRVTGDVADVHYFPEDGHPGFRCVAIQGLLEGGVTTLVYAGCDPWTGEDTPNEFIISIESARVIAEHFFVSKLMSNAVRWLEL